jgi:hypothetical protein
MKTSAGKSMQIKSPASFRFGMMLGIAALALIAGVTMLPAATGDTVADAVLGQPDFLHEASNTVDGAGLSGPDFVAIDRSVVPNRLYVADTANNRVLAWNNAAAFANGAAADLVLGQLDFYSSRPNLTSSTSQSANGLSGPTGIAVDSHGNVRGRYREQSGARIQ